MNTANYEWLHRRRPKLLIWLSLECSLNIKNIQFVEVADEFAESIIVEEKECGMFAQPRNERKNTQQQMIEMFVRYSSSYSELNSFRINNLSWRA